MLCLVRGDIPDSADHVQVLTVGLFDGIGALRVAADALGLPMSGHVSCEVSKEGSRVEKIVGLSKPRGAVSGQHLCGRC